MAKTNAPQNDTLSRASALLYKHCVCVCVCVCCIVLYCIVFILMGWDPPLPAIYPVVKAWDGLYLVARLVRE